MSEASPDSCRPFLPARDFAQSQRFYEALGFVKELDAADVAIYRMGASSFLLQKYYQKEWAENFMMQLMVDDLDAWWSHPLARVARGVRGARTQAAGVAAVGIARGVSRGSVRRAVARRRATHRRRPRSLTVATHWNSVACSSDEHGSMALTQRGKHAESSDVRWMYVACRCVVWARGGVRRLEERVGRLRRVPATRVATRSLAASFGMLEESRA